LIRRRAICTSFASSHYQRGWSAEAPPAYFWGTAANLPDGWHYEPDARAIAIAFRFLRSGRPEIFAEMQALGSPAPGTGRAQRRLICKPIFSHHEPNHFRPLRPAHRDSKAGQESAPRLHRGHCGCHHRLSHTRQGLFQPPLRLVAELRRVRHHDVVSLSHGERADAPRPSRGNDLEGELPQPPPTSPAAWSTPRSPDWRCHDPRQVGIARWKQITAHQIPNLTFTMADYFTHHTAKEYVRARRHSSQNSKNSWRSLRRRTNPPTGSRSSGSTEACTCSPRRTVAPDPFLSGSCNTSATDPRHRTAIFGGELCVHVHEDAAWVARRRRLSNHAEREIVFETAPGWSRPRRSACHRKPSRRQWVIFQATPWKRTTKPTRRKGACGRACKT